MWNHPENLQKFEMYVGGNLSPVPVPGAQIDESVMLNRLLPDGQIIHVSRKFYCSRRMQGVRSCCQQVCSFITGHGKVARKGKTTENTFCLMLANGVDHYFWHDYSRWQTALEKYNVINMRIHFETFVYLRFRWPLRISSRLLSHVYQWDIFFPIRSGHNEHTTSVQWFIFHTSSNKTSCENSCSCNPYHWSCKA